jgi:hypothetical protein
MTLKKHRCFSLPKIMSGAGTVYHELNVPLNKNPYPKGISPLNYLYPGRQLTVEDGPDRTDIPAENEMGVLTSRAQRKADILRYATNLERAARAAGGGDANKVMAHPAVAPEEMLEDPDLRGLSILNPPREDNFPAPPPIPSVPGGVPPRREGFAPGTKKSSSTMSSFVPWGVGGGALLLAFLLIMLAVL